MLMVSLLPLSNLLRFEAAYRRVRKMDAEKQVESDKPYFGNLSFSDNLMNQNVEDQSIVDQQNLKLNITN